MILGKVKLMNNNKLNKDIFKLVFVVPYKGGRAYINYSEFKYFINNLYFYIAYCEPFYNTYSSIVRSITDNPLRIILLRPVGISITKDFYIKIIYEEDPFKEFDIFHERLEIKNDNIKKSIIKYNKYQLNKLIQINNIIETTCRKDNLTTSGIKKLKVVSQLPF